MIDFAPVETLAQLVRIQSAYLPGYNAAIASSLRDGPIRGQSASFEVLGKSGKDVLLVWVRSRFPDARTPLTIHNAPPLMFAVRAGHSGHSRAVPLCCEVADSYTSSRACYNRRWSSRHHPFPCRTGRKSPRGIFRQMNVTYRRRRCGSLVHAAVVYPHAELFSITTVTIIIFVAVLSFSLFCSVMQKAVL
jgi:hypothetical protein